MIAFILRYRWIIIAAGYALALFGAWGYGELKYHEGKRVCAAQVEAASKEAEIKSLKGANDVRKKVENFTRNERTAFLCASGSVWDSSDCI